MPKAPAKRTNRRKRPQVVIARKAKKAPLSSRQYSAVTKLVKNQLYKTSETKYQFKNIDHAMGIILDSKVIQTTDATSVEINQIPMPADADALNGRDGNSIQPIAWKFDGHMTIPGSSGNQDNRTTQVRLVAAFYDKDSPLNVNMTDTDIFRHANNVQGLSNDYSDIYKAFNWGKILPFYDRTFKLQPGLAHTNDAGSTIIYQAAPQAGRDVVRLRVNHFFPKGSKLSVDGTNQEDYNKRKNIVMFAITRNVNDAYPSSTLQLKILGTTTFMYKDF